MITTPRQSERRLRFQHAFRDMPYFEVWTTTYRAYTGFQKDGEAEVVDIPTQHVKAVPRRLRRSMARARARREWQARGGSNKEAP